MKKEAGINDALQETLARCYEYILGDNWGKGQPVAWAKEVALSVLETQSSGGIDERSEA